MIGPESFRQAKCEATAMAVILTLYETCSTAICLVFVVLQVHCRQGVAQETCYVKGSVESVLDNCSGFQTRTRSTLEIGEKERRRVLDAASALGSKGRRLASLVCLENLWNGSACRAVFCGDTASAENNCKCQRAKACMYQ